MREVDAAEMQMWSSGLFSSELLRTTCLAAADQGVGESGPLGLSSAWAEALGAVSDRSSPSLPPSLGGCGSPMIISPKMPTVSFGRVIDYIVSNYLLPSLMLSLAT